MDDTLGGLALNDAGFFPGQKLLGNNTPLDALHRPGLSGIIKWPAANDLSSPVGLYISRNEGVRPMVCPVLSPRVELSSCVTATSLR